MNNIYETASDLHVRGTLLYVKSTPDGYCYKETAFTNKFNKEELVNVFNMGTCIIVDGGVQYRPVSISITGSGDTAYATLTYVKTDGTTATTAVLATVISSEYTVLI